MKHVLDKWFGCCRFTYNWALEEYNKGTNKNIKQFYLNRLYACNGRLSEDKQFLNQCPVAPRQFILRDLSVAIKTNLERVKKKAIAKFKMKFKSRKDTQCITFHPNNIRIDGNVMRPYFTLHKGKVALPTNMIPIEHEFKLTKDKLDHYYIHVPFYQAPKEHHLASRGLWCSLDPGVRTFQTAYCPSGFTMKFGDGEMHRITRLCRHLDDFESRHPYEEDKEHQYDKAKQRLRNRIRGLVDAVHWRTINVLTHCFTDIIIPEFETSKMASRAKRNIGSKTARAMLTWGHYRFRQRLIDSASKKGCKVYIVTEEYTSKCCGNCFRTYNVGKSKVYRCPNCHITIDRDVNGARNIFIKSVVPC